MTTPLFSVSGHFDTHVEIGTDRLPISVKRFSRAAMEAFEKQWDRFFSPRGAGAAALSPEDQAKHDAGIVEFFESSIIDAITVAEGLIEDGGRPVIDGRGLIEVFHSRKDVLSALMRAIYLANKLTGVIRKNSNSLRGSDAGSEASSPARSGERQGSTAARAESSTSAAPADATDASDEKPDTSKSSGEIPKVH
jgi:hypothetical protein